VLCDTHCHLDFDWFDADRGDVLARAKLAGVNRLLNPGVDLASSRKAVELAEKHTQVFAAVGVHPNECGSWSENSPAELNLLAKSSRVRAIGEIGLDFYRNISKPEIQRSIFRKQLEIAYFLDLPVVVHVRDQDDGGSALDEAFEMLGEHIDRLKDHHKICAENPGVLHAFSGDVSEAERAVAMGLCLGIGGPVTYKKAEKLQAVVIKAPLEYILLETDAPFLSPVPQRGKRNEPANVRLVAEQISRLRNLDSNDIFSVTTQNAKRLFRW